MHVRRAANGEHKSMIYDIIATVEKQATAKQAFVFPTALTSKRPMKSDRERVSAGLRV